MGETTTAANEIRRASDAMQAVMLFLRNFCCINENFSFHTSTERSQEIAKELWQKLLPCIELYFTEALQRQHVVRFEFVNHNTHYGMHGLTVPKELDEFLRFFRPESEISSYSLITLTQEAQDLYRAALKCPMVVIADNYVTFGAELLWQCPIS